MNKNKKMKYFNKVLKITNKLMTNIMNNQIKMKKEIVFFKEKQEEKDKKD